MLGRLLQVVLAARVTTMVENGYNFPAGLTLTN